MDDVSRLNLRLFPPLRIIAYMVYLSNRTILQGAWVAPPISILVQWS